MIRMRESTSRLITRSRFSMEVLSGLQVSSSASSSSSERKWLMGLLLTSSMSILLLLANLVRLHPGAMEPLLVGDGDVRAPVLPVPPKLAYLISGTRGDGARMQRTLQAVYHPWNYYLLHLDRGAPVAEQRELARFVREQPVFAAVKNVFVVAKPNLVTYRGPTMIAATLHGAAILLRKAQDWDWFINLSASDYPLVTQDDLLHVFSYVAKDLNFIEHTSDMGWKEFERAKPIIFDPGLYQRRKSDIFWGIQRRAVPTAFRLFTGSAWTVLTRGFIEYVNVGWDNLPRTLLMYYANFVSSPEGYFHTVICNSPVFRNTTVNHDLHFIAWDYPPKQHPLTLSLRFFPDMAASGAAFARKFDADDPVLLKIDTELLQRRKGQFTPGGWCVGDDPADPCTSSGDPTLLRPGGGARRLEELVVRLLAADHFRSRQCAAAAG